MQVGRSWEGLAYVARKGAVVMILDAADRHPNHLVLQAKCLKALSSGVDWPPEIQVGNSQSCAWQLAMDGPEFLFGHRACFATRRF